MEIINVSMRGLLRVISEHLLGCGNDRSNLSRICQANLQAVTFTRGRSGLASCGRILASAAKRPAPPAF